MDLLKTISFTPEWVQAIASVIGVFGLLLTIIIQSVTVRIQAKTSALQAEQIFRDKDVQRVKLMPYFSVSTSDVLGPKLMLELKDNDINMVAFEACDNLPIKLGLNFDFAPFRKVGERFIYDFHWLNEESNFDTYKIIKLEYLDLIGNYYNQTVQLTGRIFSISPPMINYTYQIEYLKSKKVINRIKSIFKKKKKITSIFPKEDN